MPEKYKQNISVVEQEFFPVNQNRTTVFLVVITIIIMLLHVTCLADDSAPPDKMRPPVLKKAVLCEKVLNRTTPVNAGVVFSSDLGRLICFTYFDPVYEKTFIYYKFYFKDKLLFPIKLALEPPSYATQSSIQLRESDKGPWRVEITDAAGNILSTIRFSITD